VSTRPLILVADDDARIAHLIAIALSSEGFRVVTVTSGEEALTKAEELRPDVVLLDMLMPDLDGLEVMSQLRIRWAVPVILVTGQASIADKAKGLDLGADDYIAKPFHPDELVARVRAVMRRAADPIRGNGIVAFDDIQIDLDRRRVSRAGEVVKLTSTEWVLLQHLATNRGKVLLYAEILTKVWGPEYQTDLQYLRVWVSRVRRKLGADAGQQGRIRTVQGIGYCLMVDEASDAVGKPAEVRVNPPSISSTAPSRR
jgi:two-component system, OmpR family, KDP operon response regulator KdpE